MTPCREGRFEPHERRNPVHALKCSCKKPHRRRAIHKFGFSRPNTSIAQGISNLLLSLSSPTWNAKASLFVTNSCNKWMMAAMPCSKPFLGPWRWRWTEIAWALPLRPPQDFVNKQVVVFAHNRWRAHYGTKPWHIHESDDSVATSVTYTVLWQPFLVFWINGEGSYCVFSWIKIKQTIEMKHILAERSI